MYEYPNSYASKNKRQQGHGGQMGPIIADPSLIRDISKAVVREVHAYNFYEKLAQLAPNIQDYNGPRNLDMKKGSFKVAYRVHRTICT